MSVRAELLQPRRRPRERLRVRLHLPERDRSARTTRSPIRNCDGIDGDITKAIFVATGGNDAERRLDPASDGDDQRRYSPRRRLEGLDRSLHLRGHLRRPSPRSATASRSTAATRRRTTGRARRRTWRSSRRAPCRRWPDERHGRVRDHLADDRRSADDRDAFDTNGKWASRTTASTCTDCTGGLDDQEQRHHRGQRCRQRRGWRRLHAVRPAPTATTAPRASRARATTATVPPSAADSLPCSGGVNVSGGNGGTGGPEVLGSNPGSRRRHRRERRRQRRRRRRRVLVRLHLRRLLGLSRQRR